MKEYKITARSLKARPRSKRLRETGGTGGSTTVVHMTGGTGGTTDPNSHTHENKSDLDRLGVTDGYLYITQRNKENIPEAVKTRAGYADEAGDLSEDAPVREEFVSRLHDDVIKGALTFEQALKMYRKVTMNAGTFTSSVHSCNGEGQPTASPQGLTGRGFSMYTRLSGETVVEADEIIARKIFRVNVLDIQNETFSAGNVNLTEANGTIYRVYGYNEDQYANVQLFGVSDGAGQMQVLAINTAEKQEFLGKVTKANISVVKSTMYKIYFMRTDDEVTIEDRWHRGDMAYMKTLNVSERYARAWHRVVTEHGVEKLEDGRMYNYIVVSNAAGKIQVKGEDGSIVNNVLGHDTSLLDSIPMPGDKVVQYGSVSEKSRMGLLRLDSRSDGNGGIYLCEGVGMKRGTFEQFKPLRVPITITPKKVELYADLIKLVARDPNGDITGETNVGEKMSYIEQKADKIELKVKADGGPNLLENSKAMTGPKYKPSPAAAGCLVRYKDFESSGLSIPPNAKDEYYNIVTYSPAPIEPGKEYTLSLMYYGSRGSQLEIYVYSPSGSRAVEWARNNNTGEQTQSADGRTVFTILDGTAWEKGSVTFKTAASVTPDVTIVLGRLYRKNTENTAYICAPKLEPGGMPTEWRPCERDIKNELLDTGIDVENQKVTVTADTFEVRNNSGEPTALVTADGKITTKLIEALQVVTDALKAGTIQAGKAVINDLILGGRAQFGDFFTNPAGQIQNGADSTTIRTLYGTGYNTTERYTSYYEGTAERPYQEVTDGYRNLGNNRGETAHYTDIKKPVTPNARIIGNYTNVVPSTNAEIKSGKVNVSYFAENGVFVGLRPMLRNVEPDELGNVRLNKYDYTVLLSGTTEMNVFLPSKTEARHGQRVEIRNCTSARNNIRTDAGGGANGDGLSDNRPIGMNGMKVYIYDQVRDIWWVNTLQ